MKAATEKALRLRRRDLLATMLAPVVLSGSATAQSGGAAVRTRPATTTHFRIELPEKDWRLLPAGVNTLGCLVHKDDVAAIVIEHELLQITLAPDEVDTNFAELEMATIREREVTGTGFSQRLDQTGRRRVVVDFQRRASAGPEQVRVFVLVQGQHLYRLVCASPANQFSRYAQVFQVVCASFTPLDAA
ncbi:MAG: hypothetical protein ABI039_00155 [Vicinamibacterales bacterium]